MAYEQRNDTGSLFKNKDKKSDNHPDYNGSAMIDDVEYWMSAWLKTSDKGTKWMSFAFKPKEEEQEEEQEEETPDLDDEIPF